MSAQVCLVTMAVAAALASLALGRPTHVRSVDLSEAINKTVCPITVDVDEHPDRVPRRIKVIRCAQEADWCAARHLPHHECCQHAHAHEHAHGALRRECVEMRDTVLVYFKSTGTTSTHEVSVGCNCMIEQSTHAPDLPDGPPT